ncbi:hypothetical protein Pse7367_2066 [Thalassoporum mexicanum PCC 7367]|uniref:LamG domain-containing protein n=1 Tax=Thalassoporum mexicanum TaxID=3457544 RepID=UPI00029FCEB9|nr:LamG-like jellyroll fold domain-containing protein [Pseudanabaena sp. PCC 7367]AFY70334.1 hypothetical protein Pse7367_2066 [Pseudanabaena sp. PCC 7367]
MQPQWANYIRTYSDRNYQHTALVSHTGVLIAFAIGDDRRIYYNVLDQQNNPESIDVNNWLDTPQELIFPREIAQVGFAIVANKGLPMVRSDGEPATSPADADWFHSSTARLTEIAPFQVFSDNQYVYLFRQAIAAGDPNMITVNDVDGEPQPIVDRTLLVDRFILAGTMLKTVREVRYRRSRHKVLPAGPRDSVGAVDMNNMPFYEPTQELDFVRNIGLGRFSVIQVPSGIPDVNRWQIFVHNHLTERIDSYNIERSADGLFNTQGSESPAAFERMGHAETALRLESGAYVTGQAQVINRPSFNISVWIKPESTGTIYAEGIPAASTDILQLNIIDTNLDIDGQSLAGYGLEVVSYHQATNNTATVRSAANVIEMGEWNFISLSFLPMLGSQTPPENSGVVVMMVGNVVVNDGEAESSYLLFPTHDGANLVATLGINAAAIQGGTQSATPITATIDELSIWDRARSETELQQKQSIRLVGNEFGLLTYWQFDEGSGDTIYDQTDTLNSGTLNATSGGTWLQSDAPVGDNPNLRRTSFGFGDRNVAGKGIAAMLYYQQEMFSPGDNRPAEPTKQSARVMLAATTTVTGEDNEPKIAVLDFGVDRRGRLSQVPDRINLPLIETGDNDPNALIAEAIQLEQTDIPTTQAQIEFLQQEIARNESLLATYAAQITESQAQLVQLQNQQIGSGVTLYQNRHYIGLSARLSLNYADNLPSIVNGDNDSIQVDSGITAHLYTGANFTGSVITHNESRTVLGGTYFSLNARSARIVVNPARQQQIDFHTNRITSNNALIDEINNVILPDLQAQLAAAIDLLASQQARLADIRNFLQGQLSLPMGLIHIDPNGFNVVGGLLDFAITDDAPELFESGSGMLRIYYRGLDDRFQAITYNTNVSRASVILSGVVQMQERAPGLGRSEAKVTLADDPNPDGTLVTITDDSNPSICQVTLTNRILNITETWQRVPRDPAGFAQVISGAAREIVYLGRLAADLQGNVNSLTLTDPAPTSYQIGASIVIGSGQANLRTAIAVGDTTIEIEPIDLVDTIRAGTTVSILVYTYDRYSAFANTGSMMQSPYDLKYGSMLVELLYTETGNIENVSNMPLTGESRPNAWITDSPGNALEILSGHLEGDPSRMIIEGDRSIETWIYPERIVAGDIAYLVSQHTPEPINEADPPASSYGMAIEGKPFLSALQLNGTNTRVDLAGINLANRSFTIEIYVKRNAVGGQLDFIFSQGSTPTAANQSLHIGFLANNILRYSFWGVPSDMDTTQAQTDTNWHHWTFTYDVNTNDRKIYRDGIEQEAIRAVAPAPYNHSGTDLHLGYYYQGNDYGRISVDEVRIWDHVRDEFEINRTIAQRLKGDEAGLMAYYHFDNSDASNRLIDLANDPTLDGEIIGSPTLVDSPIAGYVLLAAVREKYLTTVNPMNINRWKHLAAIYNEAYALRFDGNNDYLDCGGLANLASEGDFTIEFIYLHRPNERYVPILQKGRVGRNTPELTCWICLRRTNATFVIYFGYEDSDGNLHVASSNSLGIAAFSNQRITITGKQEEDNYTVRMYRHGSSIGVNNNQASGGAPVTNGQTLEVGRVYGTPSGSSISGDELRYLESTLSSLRFWNRARTDAEIRDNSNLGEELIANWGFEEGTGNITTDTVRQQDARIVGAIWVPDIVPENTRLELYVNGMPIVTQTREAIALPENQFNLGRDFRGEIDEVRIWQEVRSQEQLLDNLFSHLKGERRQLLAYYEFESDPVSQGNVTTVNDGSLRGNQLTTTTDAEIRHVFSSAPISDDAILVRNALGSVPNEFQETVDRRPAIAEYADLQTSQTGVVSGIHKRCYSFVQNSEWHLFTGYKVGSLITEWISQVQFDPQIIGYIEGAPPTPSENLTAGIINDAVRDYVNTTSLEFVESDNVSYTISTSKNSGFNSSFEASLSASIGLKKQAVTAPLGVGVATDVVSSGISGSVGTKLDTNLNWSSSEQQGSGINVSRNASVSLGGNWGTTDIDLRLNKELPRRYLTANVGFAIVESETADLFAIRMAHNRALVAFRILPNPDIPKDTNIISFPINSRYTKQGTLDGAVGYDQNGKVLDPDYPEAANYGEYSYFKPREAYALRRQIQNEEVQLRTFYQDFSTTPPGSTGILSGGLTGAALGLAASGGGVAAPFVAAAGIAAGGLIDALASDNDLPDRYANRNIVNTYVWTADGGLYSESTQTADSQQESHSGSYNFQGNLNFGFSTSGGLIAGVDFDTKATFGGSLNLTKGRTEDASQSFSINVVNNTPGDLQRFTLQPDGALARDRNNLPIREYDVNGVPINHPGKVDAYRFFTFYLTPDTNNYDTFFNTVVDPIWLEQNNSANAQALRQAQQTESGPACWRIFHRVTFISRILPEFPDPTAPPLDRAVQGTDMSSSYELIRLVEPFVQNATGSTAEFDAAIRNALRRYLPELSSSLTQEVVIALAEYFGVEGLI